MLLYNFNGGFYNSGNTAKRMDGTNASYYSLSQMSTYNPDGHYCGTGSSNYHVIIGGGNTEVTKDDYDMADTSIIASDKMKSVRQQASYSDAGGATATTQWSNMSSDPITVKEIGLAMKVGSGSYSKNANILVARKVLSTPVTVQPGETYAFSYNIKV